MNIQRLTVECLDVPIGGNRVCRLALSRNSDGEPEALALALGWGTGSEWREDRSEGLTLPPEALPGLRDALAVLDPR